MADNADKIAEIDETLQSGAKSITTDGVSVTIDTTQLTSERARLIQTDDTAKAKRPRVVQVDMRCTF